MCDLDHGVHIHMAKLNTKYAVHLLQNLVLEIPPYCLLFLAFSYYEALMDTTFQASNVLRPD